MKYIKAFKFSILSISILTSFILACPPLSHAKKSIRQHRPVKQVLTQPPTEAATPNVEVKPIEVKAEVQRYLEGLKLEAEQNYKDAANRYQEALTLNPTFILANRRLDSMAKNILTDHRQLLKIEPGYSIKPQITDKKAIRPAISVNDVMPGYLMIYNDPNLGKYALFSLKSRFMHNVHYLITKEDDSWKQFPSAHLSGVTRFDDILIYHQPGEALQEGFIRVLISAYLGTTK